VRMLRRSRKIFMASVFRTQSRTGVAEIDYLFRRDPIGKAMCRLCGAIVSIDQYAESALTGVSF
jgi:hypothetical protein